ncbi:hypothetical protein ACFL6Y_10365 [Elusimicrobiota bacterium]
MFVLLLPHSSHAEFDVVNKLKSVATEIATNPGGFLYDLHQMTESLAPTRTGRRLTINSQLMPSLFPFTFANVSGRFNVFNEHGGGIPQMEVFGGYSKMVALEFVDTDSTEGTVQGYHAGISIVDSIHPKARVQFGYQRSLLSGKATFKKKPIDVYGTSLSSIKVNIQEDFFIAGAEILRGNRKYMFTQMGFGLESSKIFARIVWVGRVWDWGLAVYPEGSLVVYPTLGFKFGV